MIYVILLFLSIILECFPISSSGNMYLLTKLLSYVGFVLDQKLIECIDYLSHGAIAATVAIFFFNVWRVFFKKFKKSLPIVCKLIVSGFITELITVCFWMLSSFFKNPSYQVLAFGFFCTTILLCSMYFCKTTKHVTYNLSNAWILGLAQGIALMPGISRFGTTFVVARWLGFRSNKAFQLSFLIGWPINCAAFMLGIYTLSRYQMLDVLNLKLGLVMVISSCVALFCLRLVKKIVDRQAVWIFAGYTALLSLITLLISFIRL